MKYAKNVEGFQGKTAGEVFDSKNEQSRRELLKDLSAEQYCQLIAGINGVLRGRDQKDWDMDGVGVTAACPVGVINQTDSRPPGVAVVKTRLVGVG